MLWIIVIINYNRRLYVTQASSILIGSILAYPLSYIIRRAYEGYN